MAEKKHVKHVPEDNLKLIKIGFIGAGKVTQSIIDGLVRYGDVPPNHIFVSAPSRTNIAQIEEKHPRVVVMHRNLDVFAKHECDIVFIAVNGSVIHNLFKLGGPNRAAPLCTNYIPNLGPRMKYVLSLVTGFELKTIKSVLLNPEHPDDYQIKFHRIVMNCGAGHGHGFGAVDCMPEHLDAPLVKLFKLLCKEPVYIPEKEMDAACAVCSTGLAFSYYFIDAFSDGGLKIGFEREKAVQFVAKMAKSAAQVLGESRKHPTELKNEVCAPSGGAIYGLNVLDQANVAHGLSGGVEAAYKRAMSLAKEDNPA